MPSEEAVRGALLGVIDPELGDNVVDLGMVRATTISGGMVEVEIARHTKLEGDIGANSNGRVGVKMEWDY